jgi:lysozyme family protein
MNDAKSSEIDFLAQYPFLRDASISDDLKKFLLERSIQSSNEAWTRQFEVKKWRWSTPLAVALTGLITLGGNFLFNYMNSDADARRKSTAAEREFEYKIVEQQLTQTKNEAERASVLLFLVRAGVLTGLKTEELTKMAEASLKKEGKSADTIGVPSLGAPRATARGLGGTIRSDDDILDRIMMWQGGFVVAPDDPLNPSNAGITLATLSSHLGRAATIDELKTLPRSTIHDIYRKKYIDRATPGIKDFRVRAALVNLAIWSGPVRAIRSLQSALSKITGKEQSSDGELTPEMVSQANSVPDQDLLIEHMNCAHLDFLKKLRVFERYKDDLINRLREFSPETSHNVCPELS